MLISTITDPNRLADYRHADALVIGLEGLDARSALSMPLERLESLKDTLPSGQKLFVNCLKILHPEDEKRAFTALERLKGRVDGIYVSDEGYLNMAAKLQMLDSMIFSSETLITNALDAAFYLDLGIQAISLAHDLSLQEVLSIARDLSDDQKSRLEVLIHGRFAWMESRRPFLSNYLERIHRGRPEKNVRYEIRETGRLARMPIVEDGQGSVVYSPEKKNSYAQLASLAEGGIRRFRLDSILDTDEKNLEQLELYVSLLHREPVSEEALEGSDDTWRREVGVMK